MSYVVAKNKGANRNVVPPGLSTASVLVNSYFALLRLLFTGEHAVTLNTTLVNSFQFLFCKSTESIADFARLGGTLGHLQKSQPAEEHADQPLLPSLEAVMVDTAAILYHLGVANKFKTLAQQQAAVRQALAQLSEAKARMKASEAMTSRLDSTVSSLLVSVVDGLRLMTYSRAVLVGDKQPQFGTTPYSLPLERQRLKQETMYSKAVFLAELILLLSKQGTIFSYVPEYYLESMVDCFHSLRRAVPPLPFASEKPYTEGLKLFITIFIKFLHETRIVNPDIRDLLLQSIGVLMQYDDYVGFVANLPELSSGESLQITLVRSLLQAFDKKFWVTVTSVLLRFWKGYGLGQTAVIDPPVAVFRDIFKDIVRQDDVLLSNFINNLFNILNSTISELSVIKLDATKMTPNELRKPNFLFELSINLLRILEFISIEIPQALLHNELNVTRLLELLLLVLTRTTISPDAVRLDPVLVMESHVSRAWILAPLVGILLNLDANSTNSVFIDTLENDASFKMSAFEYLLQFTWVKVANVSTWMSKLEEFVGKLKTHEARKAEEVPAGDSGISKSTSMEMCSICYGAPIDTQFEPCKHSSCHKCISRHLLNNTRCFFCNADVVSTHPTDGHGL